MATPFLWSAGSSGLYSPAFTLISADLASLASSGICYNSTTTFSSTYSGQAIWAKVYLNIGSSIAAPAAGANVCGWFRTTPDAGTTIETASSTVQIPRPPDWIIPFSTYAANSSSVFEAIGLVMLPSLDFRVTVMNNLGVALGTSTVMTAAPVAMSY